MVTLSPIVSALLGSQKGEFPFDVYDNPRPICNVSIGQSAKTVVFPKFKMPSPSDITMVLTDEQPLNASLPMLVSLSGSVRDSNLEQPLNAELPIDRRLSGNAIADKRLQPSNADVPIVLNPVGRSIDVNVDNP